MEQASRTRAHLERILLVCGEQDAGKSRLLRHMLGDPRLGGRVPSEPRIRARALSRERCLTVRFTSPHEMGETLSKFLQKIDRATEIAWWKYWRVNYATAIQPRAFKNMPGLVDVCVRLASEFQPERIRVVQLAPDQWGGLSSQLTYAEVDELRRAGVEVITLDARRSGHAAEPGNVTALADFFDFT